MTIQELNGTLNANDAAELLALMVQLKIKCHEQSINSQSNEEDIKTREENIKQLQNTLFEFRKSIHSNNNTVKVEAILNIH